MKKTKLAVDLPLAILSMILIFEGALFSMPFYGANPAVIIPGLLLFLVSFVIKPIRGPLSLQFIVLGIQMGFIVALFALASLVSTSINWKSVFISILAAAIIGVWSSGYYAKWKSAPMTAYLVHFIGGFLVLLLVLSLLMPHALFSQMLAR